jgi:hypothetical protein
LNILRRLAPVDPAKHHGINGRMRVVLVAELREIDTGKLILGFNPFFQFALNNACLGTNTFFEVV